MIFEYIENLRKKPHEVRKTYAMVLSVSITIIIVLIWLLTFFFEALGTRVVYQDKGDSTGTSTVMTTKALFDSANSFLHEGSGTEGEYKRSVTPNQELSQDPYSFENSTNMSTSSSSPNGEFNNPFETPTFSP